MGIGKIALAQEDGELPTTLAAGSAPGESGVSVLRLRFQDGAHFNGTAEHHLIFFQISPRMHFECRFDGRPIGHEPPAGRLAIAPVGIDFVADAGESLDAIFVAIDPKQLSLAAAESSALDARLGHRLLPHSFAELHAREIVGINWHASDGCAISGW
jgi:AraC family transcriptional regulator